MLRKEWGRVTGWMMREVDIIRVTSKVQSCCLAEVAPLRIRCA